MLIKSQRKIKTNEKRLKQQVYTIDIKVGQNTNSYKINQNKIVRDEIKLIYIYNILKVFRI